MLPKKKKNSKNYKKIICYFVRETQVFGFVKKRQKKKKKKGFLRGALVSDPLLLNGVFGY